MIGDILIVRSDMKDEVGGCFDFWKALLETAEKNEDFELAATARDTAMFFAGAYIVLSGKDPVKVADLIFEKYQSKKNKEPES